MIVAILGSGSRGNATAVSAGACTVLVDAGFGPANLRERACAAGVSLEAVTAILLTHEHGDHARGAAGLARSIGCPVYGSAGTLAALRATLRGVQTVVVPDRATIAVGPFEVTAARTAHDGAEPLLYLLAEPATGARIGIACDLGHPTPEIIHLLRSATCLVLEANHDEAMLRSGPYPRAVQDRIAGPGGHLSNDAAAALAARVCHEGLRIVVLAHLSDRCNRPYLAASIVQRALARVGYAGRFLIATQHEPLPAFTVAGGQLSLGVFAGSEPPPGEPGRS